MMKLIAVLIVTICLNAAAKTYAQQVSLDETNTSLDVVLKKITQQTDYHFVFTDQLLKRAKPVTTHLQNVLLSDALAQLFATQPLGYTVYNKIVSIKEKGGNAGTTIQTQENDAISGTVTDGKGQPLPGATVFLTHTKKAVATDGSGKFTLKQLSPGVYELVVKMLGYEIYSQAIQLQNKALDISIKLKENSILLNTVEIRELTKDERKSYLALFNEYFLGKSKFAAKCKILNPEVIDFSYDTRYGILKASSEKLLIIRNEALGYNVHYLLKQFNMDMVKRVLFYDGSPYLEELEGTPAEHEKWEKNRETTYLGSKWHFFKAAFSKTLQQEGFLVYKFPNNEALSKMLARNPDMAKMNQRFFLPIDDPDYLFTPVDDHIKKFNLASLKRDSATLYIVYTKNDEPNDYASSGRSISIPFKVARGHRRVSLDPFSPGALRAQGDDNTLEKTLTGPKQVSSIYPLYESVMMDSNGNINPAGAMVYGGYWTWDMAAGLLPPEYKLPTPVNSKK